MEKKVDLLEHFLEPFEKGARKILERYEKQENPLLDHFDKKYPVGDLKAVSRYLHSMTILLGPNDLHLGNWEQFKAAKQIVNARTLLFYCNELRRAFPENDSIAIVRHTSMIVALAFVLGVMKIPEIAIGRKRGGQTEKKGLPFKLLTQYAWEKSQRRTCLSMWEFLKKKVKVAEFSGHKLVGHDFVYEEGTNRITCYFPDGKSRNMGFRSFERYVRNLKNELKKKSQ
jgi:hypothetical protein